VIRFAWLQSRTQTLVAAAVLAALAIIAAVTGVHLSHLYTSLVSRCQTGCGVATSQFLTHGNFMDHVFTIVAQLAAPVLGIFWGAPMVTRELESGTYRLAWTQSVSRSRWLLTKLAVVGLATVIAAGVLTLTITWWYRVLDPLTANQFDVFDERSIAPIGYAVFAFASGALIGAIIRRTVPAMATTLAVFIAVRVAVTLWVRPHLLAPLHKTMSLLSGDGFGISSNNGSTFTLVAKGSAPQNSWTLSSQFATNSGHIATSSQLSAFVRQHCPRITPPPLEPKAGHTVVRAADPAAFHSCLTQAAQQFQLVVTYLPANRYWTLQWLETGIFFGLALAAATACYWWVTRRTT
jgi:ABC-type transport system involved in multi-copper enzyme maturation permease subunit